MDAPQDLAAATAGRGKVRVSWTDPSEEAEFFIVYKGPDADFANAAPAGYRSAADLDAAGGYSLLLEGLGDGQELFFFVQGMSTAEVGDVTDPGVSVTTEDEPDPSEQKLRFDLLEPALTAFFRSAAPEGMQVIWARENGPKPAKSFIMLMLSGPEKPGQDFDNGAQLEGPRVLRLTVSCFGDKQTPTKQLANDLQTATDRDDLRAPLDAAGYAFGEVTPVVDLSGGLDTKWEARHQFEADVHASSVVAMENGEIETTLINNGLET